jgi:nardilysin
MNPQSHGAYLRLQVLHHIAYDVDEGLHVLNGLSVSDMKSFIPELWSQVYYTHMPKDLDFHFVHFHV